MKPEKAIEILTSLAQLPEPIHGQDDNDAIKLGCEALKSHQERVRFLRPGHPFLLPGETPPDEVR